MVCKNCGKQIPDDAKFCMECGGKVEEYRDCNFEIEIKKIKEEWEKIDKEKEKNGEVFQLLGGKIVLSQDDLFYKNIVVSIHKSVLLELLRYEESFKKDVTSFKSLLDQIPKIKEIFLKVADSLCTIAKKIDVECTQEMLLNAYVVVNENGLELSSVVAINECFKSYEELQNQLNDIGNLLDLEKESRNKVVGFGDGLKGLLVSSIQAGIINAGIGGLYDIKNGVKKRSLENKMQSTLNNFATNPQVQQKILENFEMDLDKLVEGFICFLSERTGREYNYSKSYNRKEISQYVEMARSLDGEEQKKEYLFLLSYIPWNEQTYIDVYRKYGDKEDVLLHYSELFKVPYIRNYKNDIVRREKEAEEKKRRREKEAEKKKKEEQDRIIQEMNAINHRRELEDKLATNNFQFSQRDQADIEKIINQRKQCSVDMTSTQNKIDEQSKALNTICEEKGELQKKISEVGPFSFGEKGKLKKKIKVCEKEEKALKESILGENKKLDELKNLSNCLEKRERGCKENVIKKEREKVIEELDKIYNQRAPYLNIMDNEMDFGRELRWQIIDRCGSKLLLITKTTEFQKKYNEEEKEVKWENCSLRKWLNKEFKNAKFAEDEKHMMVAFKQGNMQDLIFVLNEEEAKTYFPEDTDRVCGIYGNPNKQSLFSGNCESWWLRSSEESTQAPTVSNYGHIGCWKVNNQNTYVRPVVYIDMAKLFNEKEIRKKYSELEEMGMV